MVEEIEMRRILENMFEALVSTAAVVLCWSGTIMMCVPDLRIMITG